MAADEVRIAVDYAGICGSELHTIDLSLFGGTAAAGPALPLPLGHECAGRGVELSIEAVGLAPAVQQAIANETGASGRRG